MLHPEEYQIVGEIALKANNLEEIVNLFAPAFLGGPEPAFSAKLIRRQKSFDGKKQFLVAVLDALEAEYPDIKQKTDQVKTAITEALRVYTLRDAVVKTPISFDVENGFQLNIDKSKFSGSVDLERLKLELGAAHNWLLVTCADLANSLAMKRGYNALGLASEAAAAMQSGAGVEDDPEPTEHLE